MVEYIIRGKNDEDFNLHSSTWPAALKPLNISFEHPEGFGIEHLNLVVDGNRIAFSPEPPGWQVIFEGKVEEEWAAQVAQEICDNMVRVSGQAGEVIRVQ